MLVLLVPTTIDDLGWLGFVREAFKSRGWQIRSDWRHFRGVVINVAGVWVSRAWWHFGGQIEQGSTVSVHIFGNEIMKVVMLNLVSSVYSHATVDVLLVL